jgi:hypothetical protein
MFRQLNDPAYGQAVIELDVSRTASEKFGAMGREIESRQGIGWLLLSRR